MNPIEGELVGDSFKTNSGQIVGLPKSLHRKNSAPAIPVRLGLRPEHLSLVGPLVQSAFPAVVHLSESTGAMTYVSVEALGTTLQLALSGHVSVAANQNLFLSAKPECFHLFDSATGNRFS